MKACEAALQPHLAAFIYNCAAASNQGNAGKHQGLTNLNLLENAKTEQVVEVVCLIWALSPSRKQPESEETEQV